MQKKQGISLIVLVITIIVMIILAASVVITLSNTGVINRASQAVDLTNKSQVQDLASLIWADTYMDEKRGSELVTIVKEKLDAQGVKETDWDIDVTDTGVTIKEKYTGPTLGSLITGAADYGKTVDYSVTVDGTTYTDWQIYYHNSDYVYLVSKNSIGEVSLDKGTTVASLTSDELALYEKFRVGTADKYTLVDTVNGNQAYNSQAVAQLIKDYANFANTTTYGTNVIGAIGGPTVELLVAGWNAKEYTPTLTYTSETFGYKIGDQYYASVTSDDLYVLSSYSYWLTSPSAYCPSGVYPVVCAGRGKLENVFCTSKGNVRPVVCLKSSIPATVGTTTDFSLVK